MAAIFGIVHLAAMGLAWAGCFAFFRELAARGRIEGGSLFHWVLANILWGLLLVAGVEGLSAIHAISNEALFLYWAVIAVVLKRFWIKIRPSIYLPESWDGRIILAGMALLALVLLLIGILTAPTSWDSMTYHLPRVMYWIQNHSVEHYATTDTRQLQSGPWPAFAVMNLYLAFDSDRFANLVQWWSMVSCLAGAALLARKIFCGEFRFFSNEYSRNRRHEILNPQDDGDEEEVRISCRQLLRDETTVDERPAEDSGPYLGIVAAFFVITMPPGIVQSITTQTDYVVAMWFLAVVITGFALLREPGNLIYAAAFAAALGLGVLSKATMLLFVGPLAISFAVLGLLRTPRKVAYACVGALVFSVILVPHFARNYRLFKSPLGTQYIFAMSHNEVKSFGVVFSNALRNLALHTATGIEPLTQTLNKGIAVTHRLTGLDLDDRRTSYYTEHFAFQKGFPISDNSAGNFYHLILILAGLATMARKDFPGRGTLWMIFGLEVFSYLLFCGYLRWNPWNARFHLPWFLALVPAPAIALAVFWPRNLGRILMLGFFALASICVLYNKSRPIAGSDFIFQPREQQYLIEVPYLYVPTRQVAEDIVASGVTNVGLRVTRNFFEFRDEAEYPLWVFLKNRGYKGRIENAYFENESSPLIRAEGLQMLVTSHGSPETEIMKRLPIKSLHLPYILFLGENESRWANLAHVTPEHTDVVPRSGAELAMPGNMLTLMCAAPRQGNLKLAGEISQGPVSFQGAQILLKTFAGVFEARPVTNGQVDLTIPLPEGRTAIHLLMRNPNAVAAASLKNLTWQWQVTNDPLPWAYLTRFFNPNATADDTNALPATVVFTLENPQRVLEFVSGAATEVDLIFNAKTSQPITLNVGTNAIPVKAGINAVALPATRGTNSAPIRASGPVELGELEVRVRALPK